MRRAVWYCSAVRPAGVKRTTMLMETLQARNSVAPHTPIHRAGPQASAGRGEWRFSILPRSARAGDSRLSEESPGRWSAAQSRGSGFGDGTAWKDDEMAQMGKTHI